MRPLKTTLWNKVFLYLACSGFVLGFSGRILAQAEPSPTVTASSPELPDSPGTAWAKAQEGWQTNSAPPRTPASNPTANSQTTAAEEETQKPQRPVGTAVAEAPKVSGVAAAQPAGIAIAPAKQHRVRTIVLKVGAIVGASVAVGTVIALTEGTSSKPPGVH